MKRHPRFAVHFVPTGSSWLNLVERWFGEITSKAFLNAWNLDPKPFAWTATLESIQEKLSRCRQTLEAIQPGSTSSSRSRKATK